MAWTTPVVNRIKPDIKNITIYLRTTKKWGKSTLFRDLILEKYGDPTSGILIQCGKERGATLLDNLNTNKEPMKTYRDFIDFKKWLIEEKGKTHNIQIVAFDTVDELVPIFEKETIRLSKLENPDKPCRTINSAMGGFQEGQRYTANELIKPYMDEIREAGFGIWAISHTKFKTIKEKGGTDENGYQQLSSNLAAPYESAFGDIFDVCLTGVIDRDVEERKVKAGSEVKTKRYVTDSVRKLYFRETPLIDAGGRFADGAVPEYMVFDKPNMAADFIQIVEEGMEKSKTTFNAKKSEPKAKPVVAPAPVVEEVDELDEDDNTPPFDVDEPEVDIDSIKTEIRNLHKKATPEQKAQIKELRAGVKLDDIDDIEILTAMLEVFE